MSTEPTTPTAPVERIVLPCSGLFLANRTSSWSGKPCDEAFEAETMQIDRRNCDDPKKIPAHKGTDGDWYQRGTNHRVENGTICRDLGWQREWFVRLDDVMAFVDKYGECVVGRDHRGFATIEIYDDYRE